MIKPLAAAFLASGIVSAGAVLYQTAPNPVKPVVPAGQVVVQHQVTVQQIVLVGRSTSAVNYRPRHDDTKVDLVGTNLMPKAKGDATVSGEKGHMKIVAEFKKLEAPSTFGTEYLTYVLWAITPEGRPKNLGEVQVDHAQDDAKTEVTTDLQAFALILTAEPYFAVTQPSDAVVLENVIRDNTKGNVETVNAKYEVIGRGAYLMNHQVSEMKIKPIEPGAPLDLAQARNAVELARFAGADALASETFNKAVRLLESAEDARQRHKDNNDVMMSARQAVQTAEDARILALRKR